MNTWANAVMTNQGLTLQAKLLAGTTLTITRAVVGSGYVTPGLLQSQTAVSGQKQTLAFKSIAYPSTGKASVTCSLSNDGLSTGYTAMQVGFYATDPDVGEILYFIAQAESGNGTVIPSATEMPGYGAEWTFYFQYGQASSVSVTVNPANAVSIQEFNNAVTALQNAANKYNYGTCSTASGTAAKTVTVPEFALATGAEVTAKFTNTNTNSSATLNVNGTGAKPIYYKGSAIPAAVIVAGRTYTFRYNGTQYDMVDNVVPYFGINPITSTADDTVTTWVNLGTGYAYYNTANQLNDQPYRYGFLINYVSSPGVFQIWRSQPQGPTYYRSGNSSGWTTTFVQAFDGSNPPDASVVTALTSASASSTVQAVLNTLSGKLEVQPVMTTGEDINTYNQQGIYTFPQAQAPTNAPDGNTNGWLIVVPWNNTGNSGTVKQIWLRHGTANVNDYECYVRTRFALNGSWTTWRRLYTDADLTLGAGGITYTYDGTTINIIKSSVEDATTE